MVMAVFCICVSILVVMLYYSVTKCYHQGKLGKGTRDLCITCYKVLGIPRNALQNLAPADLFCHANSSFKPQKHESTCLSMLLHSSVPLHVCFPLLITKPTHSSLKTLVRGHLFYKAWSDPPGQNYHSLICLTSIYFYTGILLLASYCIINSSLLTVSLLDFELFEGRNYALPVSIYKCSINVCLVGLKAE